LSSRIIRGIKSRLRHLGSETGGSKDTLQEPPRDTGTERRISPVERYYEHLLKNSLGTFNSFALQSRSLLARDVYAYVASQGRHNVTSFLAEIDDSLNSNLSEDFPRQTVKYNRKVLLSLASFILDTSRSDLDTQAGLQILRLVALQDGDEALTPHHKLQFVEALGELRNYNEQADLIDRFEVQSLAPMQVELMTIDRIARESESHSQWVNSMNELYRELDMQPIELHRDSSLFLMDRLTSATQARVQGPKVSIIMPTFSPDAGIYTALRSLLDQTWSNLEIIVVDDGSPVQFDAILSEIENFDSRIRVIRQPNNLGAYVARNSGLAQATGEFVTTHDDDDWSHPEKIATQASALVNDESVAATTSAHIRTTPEMHFRRINSRPRHLQTNYSSLMFRKSVTDEIGGWDSANRGSDTELAGRITHNFGSASVVHLLDKPLSFSRVWDGSLTSGEVYRGYFAYSRLLYRWSFRQWHRSTKKHGLKPVTQTGQTRPYAIPTTFEPGARNEDLGKFDVVFVTDFTRQSRFVDRVLHEIEAAVSSGFRVGYMHLDSPQTIKRAEIPPKLFELQLAGSITQVADNNRAEAALMVIYDGSIGMFLDQFKSSVKVCRGVVVDDKGALLTSSLRREASCPRLVLEHLDEAFDTKFQFVGAANEEHEQLMNQLPPDRVLEDRFIWNPHIDSAPAPLRSSKRKPVIGFHSFGNKFRWPSTLETFQTIYSVDKYETLFYGLLKPATNTLGADIFTDSQRIDYRSTSLDAFFDLIDFWVYYPHERLLDRPWQAVLLALQAGKVVILPQKLEPIYGAAAVYAEPHEVASIVSEYSQDDKKYIEQAERGQKLIEKMFDQQAFTERLGQLMTTASCR